VTEDVLDAVFYPGSHGPFWDLAQDADSKRLIETFSASDMPLWAVCDAHAVFQLPQGDGRQTTGFWPPCDRLYQH
jgi:putative intracellular protease/amidase